jgi:amino acid adenylation domain-containing protein
MNKENIETILELTPMQQGMLYHSIYTDGDDPYIYQYTSRLRGQLKVAPFTRAWRQVVERHQILRASFFWKKIDKPLQVISRVVELPITQLDWSQVASAEQEKRLEAFLKEDRSRGFDLEQAPLMRFCLIQLADDVQEMVWSFHHILLDGWSVPLLLNEVFVLYEAFCQRKEIHLPPTRPFSDYIAWLQKRDLGEAEQFWRRALAGFTAPTPMPANRGADQFANEEKIYDLESVRLSERATAALYALARQRQFTLNTLMQGAWALLLSRYSGQVDVVFGSVVSGRPAQLEGVEQMIGLFINTLPTRVWVDESARLLAWLRGLQAAQAAARQYEFSPLVQVQGWSEVGRGAPLFESLVAFENYRVERSTQGGNGSLRIGATRSVEQNSYPLSLVVTPAAEFLLEISFLRGLFDRKTILRMLDHLQVMLESIIKEPEQRLADVSLLTEAERRQLLSEWNGTRAEFPHDKCLHELFEEQAARQPDSPAVVFESHQLSYAELNRRANQLGRRLRALGVGPETLIGICVERGIEMAIGVLGALKAGGAYLPLDPTYPEERLRYMLADARVGVLLFQARTRAGLPDYAGQVVDFDHDRRELEAQDDRNLTVRVHPDNLAYVIYTSGSTGAAKGVQVSHRGVCNLARARNYALSPADRTLQFSSFSFDASVSEFFMTWLSGATLYLARQEALLPSRAFLRLLLDHEITTVTLPPSVLAVLDVEPLPALKTIISAGESCSAEIVRRWGGGRRFINAYGPTEGSVCATQNDHPEADRAPHIGRPIENQQVYLLDAWLRPVPVDVSGELHIGGVGLARGYVDRPDRTAEQFIPHPFSQLPGSRLYRTGDQARYLPDGNIEFLGRNDHQIKLRGFRVELGEIEQTLKRHAGVQESVVMALPGADDDKRLVAYVVPRRLSAPGDAGDKPVELWPSVAEYFVYDEVLYSAMTNDERRNESYKVAIRRLVKDKVVVDIGTGPDAILARFCAEAGARKVYAIELLDESYRRAGARLKSLKLDSVITLIHGDATKVQLPELADVCVSEIVGPIGGVEGATPILNDARRFLKDGGVMIPERSLTKIAAVTLPDELIDEPGFSPMTSAYVEKIFEQVGHKFDLRLCVKGMNPTHLISNVDDFEDLDFRSYVSPSYRRPIRLTVTRAGRIDGFLVWLNLHTIAGEVIDILEHEHCWLPVYLPVFHPGLAVREGDYIEAVVSGAPCENNLNPDYRVTGRLYRRDSEALDFDYDSHHYKKSFQQTPFYEQLFADGVVKARGADSPALKIGALRAYLEQQLPAYMLPSTFVMLDAMPLTPSGKVDRRALSAPGIGTKKAQSDFCAPRNALELQLTRIWEDLLGVRPIGVRDHFFELGGHSLLAVRMMAQIRKRTGQEIPLGALIEAGTVERLANLLMENSSGQLSPLVPISPEGELLPLFCLHPGGGNVLCYLPLAEYLDQEQPVFGIQDPAVFSLDDEKESEDLYAPMEDMAARYILAIQSVQAEGPYLLCGWSFGGFIAYEIAQQLMGLGHEVALLAILDTGPMYEKFGQADDAELLAVLCEDAGLEISASDLRRLSSADQLKLVCRQLKKTGIAPFDIPTSWIQRSINIFKARIRITLNYRIKPYPGTITLIRAAEQDSTDITDRAADPTLGWGKFSPRPVEVLTVPGNHATIFREPHVKVLSETLQDVIRRTTENVAPRREPVVSRTWKSDIVENKWVAGLLRRFRLKKKSKLRQFWKRSAAPNSK